MVADPDICGLSEHVVLRKGKKHEKGDIHDCENADIVVQNQYEHAAPYHLVQGEHVLFCLDRKKNATSVGAIKLEKDDDSGNVYTIMCKFGTNGTFSAGHKMDSLCGYKIPTSYLGSVIIAGSSLATTGPTKSDSTSVVEHDTSLVAILGSVSAFLVVFAGLFMARVWP